MKSDEQLIWEAYSKNKAEYIGNCSNIFDSDGGECIFPIFRDVSDFANKEEEFRDELDEGRDLLLSKEEFLILAEHKDFLDNPNMEFYFYQETETSPQIYVAYDIDEDMHYFFK